MPFHIKLFLVFLSLSLTPVIILSFIIPQLSEAFVTPNKAPILIILFMVVISITLISLFIAIQLSLPLRELSEIVRKVQKGYLNLRANVKTYDQIGELGSTFNTMLDSFQNQQTNLQNAVTQATKVLEEKVQDLEDSKKATLNLLEDLEESKNKEEALAKDLEKFKIAVDNVSEMIVISDSEGVMLYGNKVVEEITGYKPEETVGKKVGILWSSPMTKEYYQELWDTIKLQKKTFISEIQNKRKNGEIYTSALIITPILSANKEIMFFIGVERDISKEKEIDKAKTEFVSLASHQLRTPLSSINWNLEMLLSEDKAVGLSDDQKEYASEASQASKKMVGLVNSLLNVSRIEMGTFMVSPVITDVAEVIKVCVKQFAHKIFEKKIRISEVYHSLVPKIMADEKILNIVCQNLLENAINYTPEGGEIKVSTNSKGSDILISIADTGIGIPKSQQARIFTKMFRADNAREKEANGNGLGLYMTKTIIEYSGGKIWFESELDKGATFYVTLPLSGMKAKEGTRSLT